MGLKLINYLKIIPWVIFFSFLLNWRGTCPALDYKLISYTFLLLYLFSLILFKFKFFNRLQTYLKPGIPSVLLLLWAFSYISQPLDACWGYSNSMSKPSEAKILLQTLYNAEVGSRVDYDTYSTCLEEIGFETSPRGYYIVGFPTHDLTSTKVLKKQGKDCSGESYSVPKKLLSQDKDQLINTLKKMKSLFSKNSFTAFAIGNFSWPREESGLDIWSINDKKQLTHLQKPKIKRYMSFVDNILDIGL